MSDSSLRFYFVLDKMIIKVGLDTKKRFPHLAGKKVPWVTIAFYREGNKIINIRIDPAYINSDGYWTMEIEDKYAASLLDKLLFQPVAGKKKTDNIVSFTPVPTKIKLTDFQKELLKKRIDHDFGKGTWDMMPPGSKVNLWSKGRTL